MGLRPLFFCAALIGLLPAQQEIGPEELQFRTADYRPRAAFALWVQTDLVEIGVVVRDRNGHGVGGLGRGDFEVEDAGKKREITAFSAETSAPAAPTAAPKGAATATPAGPTLRAPRFLGLVFDDISIETSDLLQAKAAAKLFIQRGLEHGGRVAVFTLSQATGVPFTDDIAKLNDAIDHLRVSSRRPAGTDGCPTMPPHDAYLLANRLDYAGLETKVGEAERCGACPQGVEPRGHPQGAGYGYCEERVVIPLARAVWEQVRDTSLRSLGTIGEIVDYLGSMPGRRVLMMVSAGFLAGTLERQQDELANRAVHAQVVINSLDARGLYAQDFPTVARGGDSHALGRLAAMGTMPKDVAGDPLWFMAATTGGLFFHNNNDMELGFRELGMAPEFSYSLGIAPSDPPDNRFHSLKVRLTKRGRYGVQARPGYFAADRAAAPQPAELRIDREVLGAGSFDEVPARFTVSPGKSPAGEPGLRVVLHLDLHILRFEKRAGVRNQEITWVAALFDESGTFVVGREAELDFRLKEATFRRLADGFVGGMMLAAVPGKYRLRAVVQDGLDNKVTASSQPVEIR